jgi:carotenoid 1,2-hydratase
LRILFGPEHDGPHVSSDEPGAYEWWYFDALSDDGRFALVAIWFLGSPMSPYYKAVVDGKGPLPRDWCGVFFSLHEKVGDRWRERAYAYNLYRGGTFVGGGAEPLRVAVGGSEVECPLPLPLPRGGGGAPGAVSLLASPPARSKAAKDEAGDRHPSPAAGEGQGERAWLLTLDEPGLWSGRTKAELRFGTPGKPLTHPAMGDESETAAGHSWVCVAPVCRVSGMVTLANGRRVEFTGDGYHDHNFGRLPWSDVDVWYWFRAYLSTSSTPTDYRRAVVFYDVHPVAGRGERQRVCLFFHDDPEEEPEVYSDTMEISLAGEERNQFGLVYRDGYDVRIPIEREVALYLRASLHGQNGTLSDGPFYRRLAVNVSAFEESDTELRLVREVPSWSPWIPLWDGKGAGVGEVFRPARLCGPIASRAMWTRIRRRS